MGVEISIIISAKMESQVIGATLSSISESEFKDFEVIVIDDSSIDTTAEIARTAKAKVVSLKESIGKPAALNVGAQYASGKVIAIFDADSRLDKDCLGNLVNPILQGRCDASTGSIRVRGKNLTTAIVSLEFNNVFGFFENFSNRLGFSSIFHGTNFAVKKEFAEFDGKALTEDFELSLKLLGQGRRIEFVEDAVITDQAPPTISALIKQRFRWISGIMKVAWNHKKFILSLKHFPMVSYRLIQYTSPCTFALLVVLIPFFPKAAISGIILDLIFAAVNQRVVKQPFENIIYIPLLSFFYLFVIPSLILISFVLFISRKSPKWEKTPRWVD